MADQPAGLPPWRKSPYDNTLHLFRDQVGEAVEALCEHTVPAARLEDPAGEDDRRCSVCILMWGRELAKQYGDARWAL